MSFSLSVFAEEGQEIEEPETEAAVCTEATLVVVDIGEVFIISVDEDGLFVSIEAESAEGTATLGTLDFTGMSLLDIIQALLDTVDETQEVEISVISCSETLQASLEEALSAAFGDSVDTICEDEQEEEEELEEEVSQSMSKKEQNRS